MGARPDRQVLLERRVLLGRCILLGRYIIPGDRIPLAPVVIQTAPVFQLSFAQVSIS